MHRVMVKAVDMLATTEADATAVDATDDATADAACMNTCTGMDTCTDMLAGSDASNVRAPKPADMTDADATQPSDVSTATKAADVTAAEATAKTTRMTAAEAAAKPTPVAAATAAARHCLARKQTRCQQRSRQNGHHLSHHFLHSVMEWRASLRPRDTETSDAPKIGLVQRYPH
jgi:hypothetical protein